LNRLESPPGYGPASHVPVLGAGDARQVDKETAPA